MAHNAKNNSDDTPPASQYAQFSPSEAESLRGNYTAAASADHSLSKYKHVHANDRFVPLAILVRSVYFTGIIYLLIIVNLITAGARNFPSTVDLGDTFEIIDLSLSFCYTLEAILKIAIIGPGLSYFRSWWNVFDFVVVIVSLAGFGLEVTGGWSGGGTGVAGVARIFRLVRLLSISSQVQLLFSTIASSAKRLLNIVMLLSLFLALITLTAQEFFESSLSRRCHPVSTAAGISMGTRGGVTLQEQVADAPVCRYSVFPLDINQQIATYISDNNATLWSRYGNRSVTVDEVKARILFTNNIDRYGRRGEFLKYIVESAWLLNGDKEDNDTYISDVSLGMLGGQYVCPYDSLCIHSIATEKGKANFDSTPTTVALLYNVMTLEGWTAILYPLIDAQGVIVAGLFFAVIMGIGNFFIMNLTLVVILDAFERSAMLADIVKKAVEDTVTSSAPASKQTSEASKEEDPVPEQIEDRPEAQTKASTAGSILKRASSYNASGNSDEKVIHTRVVQFGVLPYSDRAKWCGQYRNIKAFCNWTYVAVVGTVWFRVFSTLVLFSNLIMETTAHGGMTKAHEDAIAQANVVFTIFYIIEVLLKFIAYPFPVWRNDAFNLFDAVITLVSTVELIFTKTSTLSILRCMRFLKVVSLSSSLRLTLATLVAAFKGGLPILSLVFLMIYLIAVLGMQIFGGNECGLVDPSDPMKVNTVFCDNVPRGNFDNIGYAVQSMFIVASGEGWREIMATTQVAVSDLVGGIFFSLSHFILGYIMVNFFVAVIINSATELKMQHAEIQMDEEENNNNRGSDANDVDGEDVGNDDENMAMIDPPRKWVAYSNESVINEHQKEVYVPPKLTHKVVDIQTKPNEDIASPTSQGSSAISIPIPPKIPLLTITPSAPHSTSSARDSWSRRSLSSGPRQAPDVEYSNDEDGRVGSPRSRAGSYRPVTPRQGFLATIKNAALSGVELLSDPSASATAITTLERTPRRRPSVIRGEHSQNETSAMPPSQSTDFELSSGQDTNDTFNSISPFGSQNSKSLLSTNMTTTSLQSSAPPAAPLVEGVASIVKTISDAQKMNRQSQKHIGRGASRNDYSDAERSDSEHSRTSSSTSSSSDTNSSTYTSDDDGQSSEHCHTSSYSPTTSPSATERRVNEKVGFFQVLRLICAWICLSPFLFVLVIGSTLAGFAFQIVWKPMLAPDHSINVAGWYIDVITASIYFIELVAKLGYYGLGVPKCIRKLFLRRNLRRNPFFKVFCWCCLRPRQAKRRAQGEDGSTNRDHDKEEMLIAGRDRRFAALKGRHNNKMKKAPSSMAIAQRNANASSSKALQCLSNFPLPRTKSYFSSAWHWLEFICFLAAVVTVGAEVARDAIVSRNTVDLLDDVDSKYAQNVLRLLWHFVVWGRILRNLRVWSFIRYSSTLYVLFKALLRSFTTLRNAAIITTLFWYMYSVLGLILFRGKLSACTTFDVLSIAEAIVNNGGSREGLDIYWANVTVGGPQLEFAVGAHGEWGDASYGPPYLTSKSDCLAAGYLWLPNPGFNFENIGTAMIAMFQEATVSDWQFPMFTSTDSRSDTQSPSPNSNLLAPIYFITFIIIMGQFLVNFIKSALIDGYFSTKSDIEEQYAELRKAKENAANERRLARERRAKIINSRKAKRGTIANSAAATNGDNLSIPVPPLSENKSFGSHPIDQDGSSQPSTPKLRPRNGRTAEPQWDDEFATIDNESIGGNIHFGLLTSKRKVTSDSSEQNISLQNSTGATDAKPWWWFSEITARSNTASTYHFATDALKSANSDPDSGFLSKLFNLRRERKINHFIMMLTFEERFFFQLYRYALYFVRPPLAVTYTEDTNPLRFALRRIFRSRALELFQCGLAIIHIFVMGSMNWPSINDNVRADSSVYLYRESEAIMTSSMKAYVAGDVVFTFIFVLIMVGKIVVYGLFLYVEKRRNWVDIFINAATLTGCLFCIITPGSVFWTATRILLFMRVWRIHYIFFADRGLLVQLQIMLDSGKSFASVLTLMALLLSTFSSIGMVLFGKVKYTEGRDGFNTWAGFDTFLTGFFTLVRVATSDNWGGILGAASTSMPNCNPQLGNCGNPIAASIFCFIFVILGAWVALNLFTAVLMEGVVSAEGDDQFPVQEEDVRQFQKRWKSLSKHDMGKVTLTLDELQLFLVLLPTRPLGLNSQFRNFKGALPLRSVAVHVEKAVIDAGMHGHTHLDRFAGNPTPSSASFRQQKDTSQEVSQREQENGKRDEKSTEINNKTKDPTPPPATLPKRHEESQLVGAASAARVLMQMNHVPVFAFVTQPGKAADTNGNTNHEYSSIMNTDASVGNLESATSLNFATLKAQKGELGHKSQTNSVHYFVYPDDVFDALVRLHYGSPIPLSAERILISQRSRRFRKRNLMELAVPQGVPPHSYGGQWKPVEVTCVAVLMATVLIQRRWRNRSKRRGTTKDDN